MSGFLAIPVQQAPAVFASPLVSDPMAMKQSVGTPDSTLGPLLVVDVVAGYILDIYAALGCSWLIGLVAVGF